MSFFQRQDIGRVYVLRMDLPDGCKVHKIGVTKSNRTIDRMMELLRSWFTHYRFVPYTELRLDMECPYPFVLEKHIHKMLAHKQFIPNEHVEGRTEMFIDLDEFRVLHYLRAFNSDLIVEGLDLTDEQYRILGNWISP